MKNKSFTRRRLTLCSDQGFTVNRVADPQHILLYRGSFFCVYLLEGFVVWKHDTIQCNAVRACDRLTRNLCNTILASSIVTIFYFLFYFRSVRGSAHRHNNNKKKRGPDFILTIINVYFLGTTPNRLNITSSF